MRMFLTKTALVAASFLPLYASVRVPAAQVYVCDSSGAVAFHWDGNCRGLARCKHTILKMSQAQAEQRGLRKCKVCY